MTAIPAHSVLEKGLWRHDILRELGNAGLVPACLAELPDFRARRSAEAGGGGILTGRGFSGSG